jgi:hypothetical protein
VFYRAMVIFARKHFATSQAGLFSLLINGAIWLRAGLAVAQRLATAATPVLLDAALLFAGMYVLKSYWEVNQKYVRVPYPPQYMLVAVPLYIVAWLTTTWLSGGYDRPTRASRVVRGVAVGTVLISAVSNFFDAWRFSKALIVLGGGWAVAALVGRRMLSHWLRHGNLRLSEARPKTLAIVGSEAESQRVRQLLAQAQVPAKIIGYVTPAEASPTPTADHLGTVAELPALLRLYDLTELIFCGQDLPASQIIGLMASLPARPPVAYKILPAGSQYIIGSSSKDAPGDYYALDRSWRLAHPAQRRNKRLLDLLTCLVVLVGSPVLVWAQRRPGGLLPHAAQVLRGRRSWVGLRYLPEASRYPAVLSPADVAPHAATAGHPTLSRLERLYAQDYEPSLDLGVLWRGWRRLGG